MDPCPTGDTWGIPRLAEGACIPGSGLPTVRGPANPPTAELPRSLGKGAPLSSFFWQKVDAAMEVHVGLPGLAVTQNFQKHHCLNWLL
mmetsp:Transcript_10208/g.24341  ORF Transcript_10208/g.24341 Transcript_10208/m.24341 type:complete len:88 (+) Transcript_10208:80-343(+)